MGWRCQMTSSGSIFRASILVLLVLHNWTARGKVNATGAAKRHVVLSDIVNGYATMLTDGLNVGDFLADVEHDEALNQDTSRQKREFDFFGMRFDHSSLPPMAMPGNHQSGAMMAGGLSRGYAKLDWKHCGNKNDAIVLRDIEMHPNPIQVPGTVRISFNMEVKENQTAPIRLRVDMKKKIPMLFGIHTWMPVPCYHNGIGSCVIEDICNYEKITFGHSCPRELIEQNISCKCPLLEGNYTVPPIEQEVPRPPSDIDPILMEGDFKVKFTMYKGHKRLTCYETNATIKL